MDAFRQLRTQQGSNLRSPDFHAARHYGFIARFNGSYRRGVLDLYVFRKLAEVKEHTEAWLRDYNEEIPHDSLNDLTPVEYRSIHHPETSSYLWT